MTAAILEQRRAYLQSFDFRGLFVEGLGWDHYQHRSESVDVDGAKYLLIPVAEKAGFVVLECRPKSDGTIPPYPVRRKIEQRVSRIAYEHLIVFTDSRQESQKWQWVKREQGNSPKCRERTYFAGLSGESILQQLDQISFTLKDEANGIGISDVASRVSRAWDVENVTKRFYERFRTELTAFRDFIEGIAEQGNRDWYASLMLNRMMFVYFVQKRGFLDSNPDYLRNRLKRIQEGSGEGHFHDFYRMFLLRLFHEGLGQPEGQRDPSLVGLLGRVPFLNGGLFDVHDLERTNTGIRIPDRAFERVFDFFDEYHWHLDERPHRADNEINPDVLGYIFEKFINQKQMGAYYTKEDITGYISRNTLIPHLFASARDGCPVAFGPDAGVFRMLRDDPDRYIPPAVGHGISWDACVAHAPNRRQHPIELPNRIKSGVEDISERAGWSAPAPSEYALPTETWHEVVARRKRYENLRTKLESGAVYDINDLITLNLDIELFAHDVIAQSEGPELVRAFWHALRKVSVLDPTCGSGAFLFAVLNILEPLYTTCLEAMGGFLEDLVHTNRPHHHEALQDFRTVLNEVKEHPSERYFILKSIVLNNLYGVDIMEEAVEICKLRLFLKLVAQLASYEQVEPLPDIDFNIRAGNTLVGFASLREVRQAMTISPGGQHRTLFPEDLAVLDRIEAEAEAASHAFREFRSQQTTMDSRHTSLQKEELRDRLKGLREELDRYLATEYQAANNSNNLESDSHDHWRQEYRPFHWFIEFYEVMDNGGFDVVVGNPPYVSSKKVYESYRPKGFLTENCPDIYASVVERSVNVCRDGGYAGMIVPLSLTFSKRFTSLRSYLYEACSNTWFSSFGRIPAALFSAHTRVRNTIVLGHKLSSETPQCFTTRLYRWFESQRPLLFQCLSYSQFSHESFNGLIPKLGSARLIRAFDYLVQSSNYRLKNEFSSAGVGHELHFKKTAYNWLTFCVDQPPVYLADNSLTPQTKYGTVRFRERVNRDLSMVLANGKLLFVWWAAFGDDFDVTKGIFAEVPMGPMQLTDHHRTQVLDLLVELQAAMSDNLVFKLNAGKNIGNYNLAKCREVTDRTDMLWLDALNLGGIWEDIELEHQQLVRTPM